MEKKKTLNGRGLVTYQPACIWPHFICGKEGKKKRKEKERKKVTKKDPYIHVNQ